MCTPSSAVNELWILLAPVVGLPKSQIYCPIGFDVVVDIFTSLVVSLRQVVSVTKLGFGRSQTKICCTEVAVQVIFPMSFSTVSSTKWIPG